MTESIKEAFLEVEKEFLATALLSYRYGSCVDMQALVEQAERDLVHWFVWSITTDSIVEMPEIPWRFWCTRIRPWDLPSLIASSTLITRKNSSG